MPTPEEIIAQWEAQRTAVVQKPWSARVEIHPFSFVGSGTTSTSEPETCVDGRVEFDFDYRPATIQSVCVLRGKYGVFFGPYTIYSDKFWIKDKDGGQLYYTSSTVPEGRCSITLTGETFTITVDETPLTLTPSAVPDPHYADAGLYALTTSGSTFCINEVFTNLDPKLPIVVFENDEIITIEKDEQIDPLGVTVPVSTLRVTVDNFDGRYSVDNPNATLKGLVKGNEVRTFFSFEDYPTHVQIETFIIDQIISDDTSGTTTIECLGCESLLDRPFTDRSWTGSPRDCYTVINDIFAQSGYPSVKQNGYRITNDFHTTQVFSETEIINPHLFDYTPDGNNPLMWNVYSPGPDINVPIPDMSCREALSLVLTANGLYIKPGVTGGLDIEPHPVRGYWNFYVEPLVTAGEGQQIWSEVSDPDKIKTLYESGNIEVYENYYLSKNLMFGFPKVEQPTKIGRFSGKIYTYKTSADDSVVVENAELTFPSIPPALPGMTPSLPAPTQPFVIQHDAINPVFTRVVVTGGTLVGFTPRAYNTVVYVTGVGYGEKFSVTIHGKNVIKTSEDITMSFNGEASADLDNPLVTTPSQLDAIAYDMVWNMSRPKYTVETRDDPQLGSGDVIYIDSRYVSGDIAQLVEAKRTFNGAVRAEYKFS